MTPAARAQAAIEILDQVLTGVPTEKALTGWARGSRFAGSKDRAAVRDHVFDAVRCKRSFAAAGGGLSGRGLILGAIRLAEGDPDAVFTGLGYGPEPLSDEERESLSALVTDAERLDLQDWVWPRFQASLGGDAESAALALRQRAPIHLRVNLRLGTVAQAQALLEEEGVMTRRHDVSPTALEIVDGPRKLRQSEAYSMGWVELQDAASQAVVDHLPVSKGQRVLDFCAGGGGKTLAVAARIGTQVFAHDSAPDRMQDLPVRAVRAGADIQILETEQLSHAEKFDVVFCDAPCSGSGAWRRAPDGKWSLTEERLSELNTIQDDILDQAADLVKETGVLVYATCSVLSEENSERSQAFVTRNPAWSIVSERTWSLADGSDGFYSAHFTRVDF